MATSLVLPCYNPADGWEQHVCDAYRSFSERIGGQPEVILVADGPSPTVTGAALSVLEKNISAFKVVKYDQNRGKGYALRQGIAEATGDIIMYTDIDFPYSTDSMWQVYNCLAHDGFDVAIGIKNDAYYTRVPYLRRVISRCLRLLTRVFLSMPVTDTQCGLKGFKRSVAPLFLKTTIDRYLFDLEFVYSCFKNKQLRVKAIPVALNENVHFRKMNYSILLPETINFIKLLFK